METQQQRQQQHRQQQQRGIVEERLDKITRYEAFLNEKLKKDLFSVTENRDRIWEEEAEYLKLKTVVERIAASPSITEEEEEGNAAAAAGGSGGGGGGGVLKAKVDLGCNFYAQARVDDPSMIFLDVGLGFHVQLTLKEAVDAIDIKVKHLHEKAEAMTLTANRIKAQIRIVMEGLRELSNIDAGDHRGGDKHRDVWT